MASHLKEEAALPPQTVHQASWPAFSAREADAASTKRSLDHATASTSQGAAAEQEEEDYRGSVAYEPTGFGEIGNFMRNKRVKLNVQYQARRTEVEQEEGVALVQLFRGARVHINGDTSSSGHTLRSLIRLLTLHGATYIPYIDRKSLPTHIIASNLTPSKRHEFREYKVVKPEWIVQSVKEGRLLDWTRFGLLGAVEAGEERGVGEAETGRETQRSLAGMFAGKGGGGDSAREGQVLEGGRVEKGQKAQRVKTETIESLSERGSRLARSALAAQSASSSALPSSFFQRRPTLPAPSPPPKPPSPPLNAIISAYPPPLATLGTTKHPWLPSADMSSRTLSLLNDPTWVSNHTSASPTFLSQYFAQSRLHHLSTWKEELKSLVASLQPPSAQPTRAKKLTGTPSDDRIIFHVDFDCFFVSAGLTTRPELRGKAVAVCHSRGGDDAASSTSEISACSYEARAKGVKSGISLGRARETCPELITIPFEFDLYKSIASRFYEILLSHASLLQAVSIDEVLMEIKLPSNPASSTSSDPALDLAHSIRAEILAATGCPASIGISHNILLARLASRQAKPANAFHLTPDLVPSFLDPLSVDDLPGIGWSTRNKLEEELKVTTVGGLLKVRQSELMRVLGEKQGRKFAEFARGVDDRELDVGKARQSVSTEVNYGIRFEKEEQVERFMRELGEETAKRLRAVGCKARTLNLKIMQRHPDSSVDPPKFLGHGHCITQNSSDRIAGPGGSATDDGKVVGEVAWKLLRTMRIEPKELRGIGIQLQKLEKDGRSVDAAREKGQSMLSFAAAPRPPPPPTKPCKSTTELLRPPPPKEHEPSPSPLEVMLPPPAQQLSSARRSLRKDPSILILSDSDSDTSSPPPPLQKLTRPIVKSGPVPKERPSEHIPSLFNCRKRAAPPTPPSTQQVPDSELVHYGIDPEIYHALPRDVQSEQLATMRRCKFAPKPEKRQSTLRGHSSKPTLSKERSKSKSRSTPPPPPLPSAIDLTLSPASSPADPPPPPRPPSTSPFLTDDELDLLEWNITDFRSFSTSVRKQLTADGRTLLKQQASLKVMTHRRALRDADARRMGLRDVVVRPSSRFMRRDKLEDIRDVLETWVQEKKDEVPLDSDLEKLAKYLEKCVARNKECNVAQAIDVLEWWEYLLGEECGMEVEAKGSARAWWDALGRARVRVQEAVTLTYGTDLVD